MACFILSHSASSVSSPSSASRLSFDCDGGRGGLVGDFVAGGEASVCSCFGDSMILRCLERWKLSSMAVPVAFLLKSKYLFHPEKKKSTLLTKILHNSSRFLAAKI